jgi:cytochrome P450
VLREDVEHRGVLFPAGTVLTVAAFTANRDLAVEGADEFDITADRGRERSLTFGAGPHFCMGSNLARAELQEGLAFLAAHLRELELDGEPEYGTITGLYGMEALPIRFARA